MSKLAAVFLRTPYNYDRNAAGDESGLDCSNDEGKTQQSFRDECDINVLVKRFGIGAELPVGLRAPTYGDFTGVDDYQSALNAIIAADDAFMKMPADVRTRFDNSAAKFVEFCSDDKNREEAVKLGLVVPRSQVGDVVKGDLPPASPLKAPAEPA